MNNLENVKDEKWLLKISLTPSTNNDKFCLNHYLLRNSVFPITKQKDFFLFFIGTVRLLLKSIRKNKDEFHYNQVKISSRRRHFAKKKPHFTKAPFVKKSSNREENVQYLYFMFLVYYCLLINTPKIYKSVMNSFVLNFRYFEILLKFKKGHAENR